MTDLLQQAIDHHQTGRLVQAEELYRIFLKEHPNSPDALALLGVLYDSLGHHLQAFELIERANKLDPKAALFKLYLGNVLLNLNRNAEAIIAFRQAVIFEPKLSEAHFNLGNALRRVDDWGTAVKSYTKAIKIKKNYIEAYNNLALALVHEKHYDDALKQAKKAVTLAPDHGESWLILCNIAEACKDYELALTAGQKNIHLLPNNYRSWFGYGVALNRLDRNEEAILAYHKALELRPDRADIWDNLGQTYQSLSRLEEAEATYRKAIDVAGQTIKDEQNRNVNEEEYGSRHWHLSLLELLRGNYTSGFARYRSRFKNVGGLVRPTYSSPLWKGEDLIGKTLLVWDEQGYGDTIMLSRFLPVLKQKGAHIIFSVHPVLKPLFENWSCVDSVLVHGNTVKQFDFHTSAFDLPHLLGTTLATIPSAIPYLPPLLPTKETQLEPVDQPRIGVVWGGSPLHLNDDRRSVPLKIFSTLFHNHRFQFFSLNRDKKPGDEALLPHLPVHDLSSRLHTFADSARFIQQMDLIITCDTATAHLAGGMGKTVWVMLPFSPDWRWLTNRSDSPWYPTARLFRQKEIGKWDNVIQSIQQALQEWKTA